MIRRVLLLACLACAARAAPTAADPAVPLRDSVPHITTIGQASAEVVPDQADMQLGMESERPSAKAAAAATAAKAAKLIDEIRAQGVAPGDIRSEFSLTARYDSVTDPKTHVSRQVFRGYAATAMLTVRLRDVAKAGAFARSLIDEGASSFQGIDYSYSKRRELERRLDGEAAKDARAAAQATADALGLALGRVLQIGGPQPERPIVYAPSPRQRAEPAAPTPIPMEAGTQLIERSVTMIFEVEGKAR